MKVWINCQPIKLFCYVSSFVLKLIFGEKSKCSVARVSCVSKGPNQYFGLLKYSKRSKKKKKKHHSPFGQNI